MQVTHAGRGKIAPHIYLQHSGKAHKDSDYTTGIPIEYIETHLGGGVMNAFAFPWVKVLLAVCNTTHWDKLLASCLAARE